MCLGASHRESVYVSASGYGLLTTERASLRDEGVLERYLGWRRCLRGARFATRVAWRASWGTSFDAMLDSVVVAPVCSIFCGANGAGVEDVKSFRQ